MISGLGRLYSIKGSSKESSNKSRQGELNDVDGSMHSDRSFSYFRAIQNARSVSKDNDPV